MPPIILRSLWTTGFALESALADVASGVFDGIEGPLPLDPHRRREFTQRIRAAGIPFVAEIATGGGYVPTERHVAAHLEELRRRVEDALDARPLFITALAGCDAWPFAAAVEFYGRALDIGREFAVELSFETHRSRPTYNPWATAALLRQVPAMRLTCDFSHWCCVCERLVLDDEPDLLAFFAQHARHLHARVGYAQGPQVPHPAAPEYTDAVAAHERWWDAVIAALPAGTAVTITPESGPDGYLHTAPFTNRAVADLDEINRWMAGRLRRRYGAKVCIGGAP